jgi:hypothetical protein
MVILKVDISKESISIINEVMKKNGFRNMGEAIDFMAKQFIDKHWNEILDKEEFRDLDNI